MGRVPVILRSLVIKMGRVPVFLRSQAIKMGRFQYFHYILHGNRIERIDFDIEPIDLQYLHYSGRL